MNDSLQSGTTPATLPAWRDVPWLSVIGPGAIIASLTIGTGELIFSSRAGSLFGYSILWVFLAVLLLKATLVYSLARHEVLSGAHPFERWMRLPGPPGWLPMTFFLLGAILFPVWVGFHSAVIGTLLAHISGVSHHFAAVSTLISVMILVYAGGYKALERVQLAVVAAMIVLVMISLILLRPDWLEMLVSFFIPRPLAYPDWILEDPKWEGIASRPIWVELATCVGVIGGSSFDYLAYGAYLREKGWGNVGSKPVDLSRATASDASSLRRWLALPSVDLTASFLSVLLISAAFVVCGHLVLGPAQQIPNDRNMLNLQAEFVTRIHPSLYGLYIAGALLAMLGTLYGTIEVAPAVLREWVRAYFGDSANGSSRLLRWRSVTWCALGGLAVLFYQWKWGGNIVDLVTPAALITGVFSCGIICVLNLWSDGRFLTSRFRMNWILAGMNIVAGLVFLAVGLKSLWDWGPWGIPLVGGVFTMGILVSFVIRPVPLKTEN